MTDRPHRPPNADDLPCEEVRPFMVAIVRRELGAGNPSIEDVAQESCLNLLRAARREHIENCKAYGATIAMCGARSWIRRKMIESVFITHPEEIPDLPVRPSQAYERLAFRIIDELAASNSACLGLLMRHGVHGEKFAALAKEANETAETVRQRWCRCRSKIRERYQHLWKLLRDSRWERGLGDGA